MEKVQEILDFNHKHHPVGTQRMFVPDSYCETLIEYCEKLYEDNQAQAKRIEELEEALRDVEWDMKQMWITLEEWIDEECKEKNGHYRVAGYKDNPFGRCVHVQDYVKQALSSTHFPPEKE